MRPYFRTLILMTLVLMAELSKPTVSFATIYGENDLVDVLQAQNHLIFALSRSVAVQMRNMNISFESPFRARTLQNSMVCSHEKFIRQPVLGTCSGFLIGPRHILTASHCMAGDINPCKEMSWVFDYVTDESATSFAGKRENVYRCKKIAASSYAGKLDYAVVQLDRPVLDRPFLKINTHDEVPVSRRVFAIHSPRGLPLKYSSGLVRDSSQMNHFTSNIDLMRGSSGAPVFDSETLEVIGIVAQGDLDYEVQNEPFCNAFKRCTDDGCRGEDATRLTQIPELENYIGR